MTAGEEVRRLRLCRRDSIAHLGGLRLDFASTGEGAVNFTHDCDVDSTVDGIERGRMDMGLNFVGW